MHTQQDAPQLVRESLRRLFAATPVRSQLPSGWTAADGPALTVVSDGTYSAASPWTRETVRITAYGETIDQARAHASSAEAWVTSMDRAADIHATLSQPLTVARDVELGCWVSAVVVEVPLVRRQTRP